MRFSSSRILRAVTSNSKTGTDWSHTIHLPKSTFPARPPPAKLEQYRKRCTDDLYAWQRANRPATITETNGQIANNEFILHDGPPYANGAVHVGHALNKILKDLILRTELKQGKRVYYQPGWDCHGLPIELKALQQSRAASKKARKDSPQAETKAASEITSKMSDSQIRSIASNLANETVEEQKAEFKSWAVMGDWNNPYKTMDRDFELRQLEIFRTMVKNDLIFRDFRPVHWSPSSRTALAESELEYDDKHKCTAAFIKMPIVDVSSTLRERLQTDVPIYALIWTTTPWTLPANKAIAVNADLKYAACRVVFQNGNSEEALYVIGHDRIQHVASFLPDGDKLVVVVADIPGSELARSGCWNILSGQHSPIVTAKFVSAVSGTGLVHMAPGHGMEDYQVCQEQGIGPAFAPVDDAGRFTSDVAPAVKDQTLLPGLDVQTEGTKIILDILRLCRDYVNDVPGHIDDNVVFAQHDFVHKNPIDWRTKKPIITRSTAQWFADVSKINKPALASLDDVEFVPEGGKSRLTAFVESRSQWCISRQRAWGVPIPVLYHKVTDQENHSDVVIQHIISVIAERGTDAWFTESMDDPAWIPASLNADEWIRKRDTMDVWFDSGTSWTGMPELNGEQVSEVYLEGSDQHRGWFQSSLLTKIATQLDNEPPVAPYKKLITHGFTLDGQGRKMSKSIGNVISPSEIITGSLVAASQPQGKQKRKQDPLGPDLLRLWAASCDYTRDVTVSQQNIQVLQQNLQKYRNTIKFLLGVLKDFQPFEIGKDEIFVYDRMILSRLQRSSLDIRLAMNDYRFFEAARAINDFVHTDLSAFYFEIVKDTLYTGLQKHRQNRQAVLWIVFQDLLQWLSVVTPHLVEECWQCLPESLKSSCESPLMQTWSLAELGRFMSDDVTQKAELSFPPLSKAVKSLQEKARTDGLLGSGLACSVTIELPSMAALAKTGFTKEELRNALVISGLHIHEKHDESANPKELEWQYQQSCTFHTRDNEVIEVNVTLHPPSLEKCPRCWQYTAHEHDHLCSRCEQAVAEISSSS